MKQSNFNKTCNRTAKRGIFRKKAGKEESKHTHIYSGTVVKSFLEPMITKTVDAMKYLNVPGV